MGLTCWYDPRREGWTRWQASWESLCALTCTISTNTIAMYTLLVLGPTTQREWAQRPQRRSPLALTHISARRVEFKGREWAFGYDDFGSGVYCCRPGTHPNATLREKIQLGKVQLSADDVLRHINRLSSEFQGRSYHLLYRNCNHFTISLARALTGRKGRYYFNRLSRLARLVVCCLPSEMHPRPGVDDARQTCLEKILGEYGDLSHEVASMPVSLPPDLIRLLHANTVKFYGRRPTQDIQMEIIQVCVIRCHFTPHTRLILSLYSLGTPDQYVLPNTSSPAHTSPAHSTSPVRCPQMRMMVGQHIQNAR